MTSMITRNLLPAALGLTLLASATLPALLPSEPELLQKSSEHKKVGEKIGECITAYVERDGRREAEEDLSEYLEKKWSKAAKGRSPLSLSDDLGAALWFATDYTKVKGIKKGKVEETEIPVGFYGEDYVSTAAIWTPKKYSAKEKYPVVICIPDAGERATDHLMKEWEDSDLRDKAILVALGMPENTENWGGLGEAGSSEKAGGAGVLLMTFRHMLENYAIDYDRVFLAGRGLGVQAAMEIANSSPDRFCGLIGRVGDAAEVSPDNLRNLPTFFMGAGKRATAFAEKVKEAGYADCTVMPDAKLPDIAAWMETISRNSHPEEVILDPGSPYPNKAYWIQIPPSEYSDEARLTAKADRASNTITIEATGISSVEVYFNDSIIDMDKPVKVICNGAVNEDLVPRNFSTMMNMIYISRSDPGKFYTASRSYDIPAASDS